MMKKMQGGGRTGAHGRGPDIVPLYHRIYVVLLQKISDGTFPAGRSMPSEEDLAANFGVSRVTIRKAMERLQLEGLVRRERGRGTFPQPPAPHPGGEENTLLGNQLRNQVSLARRTEVEVIGYEFVAVPPSLASYFEQDGEAQVLRIERVRRDARSPISHTVCYLATEFAGFVPRERIDSLPISATLASAGVKLHGFHETITATLADMELAGHLEVDVGSALIAMTRRVEGENGRTVELLQAIYRPDCYEYRVDYTIEDQKHGSTWQAMITDSRE